MLKSRNRAGRFRKQGTIQYLPRTLSNTPNAFNSPDLVGGWRNYKTGIWFNLRPLDGRELVYAAQITADATHLIECRWFAPAGVDAIMRMAFPDPAAPDPKTGRPPKVRYFNFDFVNDLEERHVELNIHCHEAV